MKTVMVNKSDFESLVSLWTIKGHKDVVSVQFNGSTMNMLVRDYIDSDVQYSLNVIDTFTADAELSEAKK